MATGIKPSVLIVVLGSSLRRRRLTSHRNHWFDLSLDTSRLHERRRASTTRAWITYNRVHYD